MADIKLKDREILRQSEEDTAILAAVADETLTGETRKVTIPGLAAAEHRENPLVAVWEQVILYNNPIQNIAGSALNLDFKAGNSGPRHNFTDGYQFFAFEIYSDLVESDADFVDTGARSYAVLPSPIFLLYNKLKLSAVYEQRSDSANRDYDYNSFVFTRISDTSFSTARGSVLADGVIGTSLTSRYSYFTRIIGLNLIYRPESL